MADLLHTAQPGTVKLRSSILGPLAAPPGCDAVVPVGRDSCYHSSTLTITSRRLLHERAAATLYYPRLHQRSWLLVSAFSQLNHGRSRLHQATLAQLVAHYNRERDERHICRCRIGQWLEQAALYREGGGTAARMPQKFWASWGPFFPREWAGPPPHHRSGARGLRVIGKVAAKGRIDMLRAVGDHGPANISVVETSKLAEMSFDLMLATIQNDRPGLSSRLRAGAEGPVNGSVH